MKRVSQLLDSALADHDTARIGCDVRPSVRSSCSSSLSRQRQSLPVAESDRLHGARLISLSVRGSVKPNLPLLLMFHRCSTYDPGASDWHQRRNTVSSKLV